MAVETIPEVLTLETDALGVSRKRALSGFAGLGAFGLFMLPLIIMMFGGGVAGMEKPAMWPAIVSASWIGGMVMTAVAGTLRAAEIARRGRLEIEGGRLVLVRGGRREELPAGAVVGGAVTPRIGGALLTLSLADERTVTAFVSSEAAGARALEALHIDPMGRPLVGRFRSGVMRTAAGFGVGLALFAVLAWLKNVTAIELGGGLVWTALLVTLVTGWLVGTRPPEIAVGADGVRIRGKVGARFIPLEQIESVKVDDLNTLELRLRDGAVDRTRIALGNGPLLSAIAHRIERAKGAMQSGDGGAALLAVLARGARSIGSWRDDLRKRVAQADYRRASVEGGELERLVGSSGASAEHRIGAALALREGGGDEARERIRIAAEQCVDPRVRIALRTIAVDAEVESGAVEEALASTRMATTEREKETLDP